MGKAVERQRGKEEERVAEGEGGWATEKVMEKAMEKVVGVGVERTVEVERLF